MTEENLSRNAMRPVLTQNFTLAIRDYTFLLNNKYPEREVLKLVGNRYKLSHIQRTIIYRGISGKDRIGSRTGRLVSRINNDLIIDGYNVIFTITNYLLGKVVFVSNDNLLRDAGEVSGKAIDNPMFNRAIDLLINYLSRLEIIRCIVFIDEPVNKSDELARLLEEKITSNNILGEIRVVKSPDKEIINSKAGIVASSDSEIIDQSNLPVVDLPRIIIEQTFSPSFLNFYSESN